jgi:DNA-binding transcriptional ArsR family regulator
MFSMNTDPQPVSSAQTLPDRSRLISAIGSPLRWDILKELSAGEPLMVSEIAQRTGCSPTLASKHLAVLLKAGMVINRRRLYQIDPHYLPKPGEAVVDFGHCLLRLNQT